MNRYTWIDDSIKIEFPVYGEVLRNTIADCEKYDREGDPRYFGMARAVDTLCKASVANGHMNQKQWDMIVSRYLEW
ncbi:MAG: hypothetical protein IJ153_04315 [Clostridia bacterium]|nr:hypothetical protein [Clostridia bacterium]